MELNKKLVIGLSVVAAIFSFCTARPRMLSHLQLAGTGWEKAMGDDCADAFWFKKDGSYTFFSCELKEEVQGTWMVREDTLYLTEPSVSAYEHEEGQLNGESVRFTLVYRGKALQFVGRFEKQGKEWVQTGHVFDKDYIFHPAPKGTARAIKESESPAHAAIVYHFRSDSLSQTVQIDSLSPGTIRFSYSISGVPKQQYRLEGTAVLKDGDLEIDEDEDGNAFPVEEYVYKKDDCYLAFRIDADTRSRMSITNSGCPQKYPVTIKSAAVLRRQ